MTSRILVTDGGERSALAVVRSLGRAGHRVEVCAPTSACLAGSSKFAAGSYRVPDPYREPGSFVRAVRDLADCNFDYVVPISDASMELILENVQADPGRWTVPFGDVRAYRTLSNKLAVYRESRDVGLRVPRTEVLTGPDNADALWPDDAFPAVIKPHRSVVRVRSELVKCGVSFVSEMADLSSRLRALPEEAFPVLLQQPVEGSGAGVFLLTWDGEVLVQFGHRRIREKPPSGGVSVYRESVHLDSRLLEKVSRLVLASGWNGVSMVELKGERGSDDACVMEVNARFWGSLQLAIDAGVDFPVLLLEAAAGGKVGDGRDYRTGIRSRWWWGDVDQLLLRLRDRDAAGDQNDGLKAVVEFLAHRPGRDRLEVCRLSDPRPFLHETRSWIGTVAAGIGSRERTS